MDADPAVSAGKGPGEQLATMKNVGGNGICAFTDTRPARDDSLPEL